MGFICNGEPNHNGDYRKNTPEKIISQAPGRCFHPLIFALNVVASPK